MKPLLKTIGRAARNLSGFTLVETMVVMAIFTFAVAGIVSMHLFGLKWDQMIRVKLTASEGARRALAQLVTDIRGAGVIQVGTGSSNTFAPAALNALQQGNALQIYPVKTNTNSFVRYFYDPNDHRLKRFPSGAAAPTIVASAVTNQIPFTSEDFAGNVLTNNVNNRVIGVRLQFFQLADPTVALNAGHYYDYFELQTRATRRALE